MREVSNGMKQRGFTVIEMIVVIVLIGILASLGTAQLLRTQLVSRDRVRADGVSTISLAFEDIAKSGQIDNVTIPSGNASVTTAVAMGYPSTKIITKTSDPQTVAILGAIDERSLKSPRIPGSAVAPNFSLIAAANNTAAPWSTAPSATNDVYVYQPLDSSGNLCLFATGDVTTGASGATSQEVIAPQLINNCVKFNMYYFSEIKNTVQSISSTKRSNNGL